MMPVLCAGSSQVQCIFVKRCALAGVQASIDTRYSSVDLSLRRYLHTAHVRAQHSSVSGSNDGRHQRP